MRLHLIFNQDNLQLQDTFKRTIHTNESSEENRNEITKYEFQDCGKI